MYIYKEFRKKKARSASLFFLILVACVFLHHIPILNMPFKWLAAIFEIVGSSIGTSINNSTVKSADISWAGKIIFHNTGTSYTAQFILKYLILILMGFIICFNAKRFKNKGDNFMPIVITIIIATVPFLYAKQISTWIISFLWVTVLVLYMFTKHRNNYTKYAILFIGCFCIIHGAYQPLLDYNLLEYSESHYLAAVTNTFPHLWLGIWAFTAIIAINYVWFRVVNLHSYMDLFK